MIRVLQFANVINRYDFIDSIVQRADPGAFEVGVCTSTKEANIAPPVYSPRTPHWKLGAFTRWKVPALAVQLARILRSWKADILHTHHYDEVVIGTLATRLYPRTRLVVGRHYSDAIYLYVRGWRQPALLQIEHAVNRRAARIVVPSSDIADILVSRQGVPPEKVDCVPYGFVLEKYDEPSVADVARLRAELGLEGRFTVGNFSRMHQEKGQRFLIQALSELRARLPEVLLLVVGDGAERANLERQIDEAGVRESVRVLGWRRDAMALMAAVDAVVQPTLHEAFSQVMAEALWMRKPLVITDVSGAVDIMTDGVNGLVVPKADPGALAAAIARLAEDEPLRRRLGAAGRAYVEEHLIIDKVIPQYEEVYRHALDGR